MFAELATEFVKQDILPEKYVDEVKTIANDYVENEDITNHRKRKYSFGGAVLYVIHNNTSKAYRPSTIANQFDGDYSPSKFTFAAYKIGMYLGEDYQKPNSARFAYEYATDLDCCEQVHQMISDLYDDVGELPGKSNSGTGAAFVYVASILSNDKRTQKDVAQVSGRSEVGIRNIYYEVIEKSSLQVEID